ncbi:MAG TPA: hypothetical protein VFF13_03655 [archaeon]|nr:hypothetical protein [archaeon]
MKLDEKNIVKKNIFFVPNDILIMGAVNDSISKKKTSKLLGFLKGLQEKKLVELFLIFGLHDERAKQKIKENSFKDFFKKENIFVVTDEYINSKEEIDKARHLEQLEMDPNFLDEYFKQHVLMNLFKEGKVSKENSVLIAHDVFFDGFYSMRFSNADFVLVKESLSDRNNPLPAQISGLNYIDLSEADFKRILMWKFPTPDLRFLETYVFNKLKEELLTKENMNQIFKIKGKLDKK